MKRIPFLKAPTESELRDTSVRWLAQVEPTFIDRWPKELLAVSAKTTFVQMPRNSRDLFEPQKFSAIAAPLAEEIDRIVGWDRHFFRLNSRSPKDALWPFEIPVTCSGKEMMHVLSCSERTLDDLCYFYHSTALPVLCLREFWPEVRPELEYRCFIVDGKILAVAEYLNPNSNAWGAPPLSYDDDLRAAIDSYLIGTVNPSSADRHGGR